METEHDDAMRQHRILITEKVSLKKRLDESLEAYKQLEGNYTFGTRLTASVDALTFERDELKLSVGEARAEVGRLQTVMSGFKEAMAVAHAARDVALQDASVAQTEVNACKDTEEKLRAEVAALERRVLQQHQMQEEVQQMHVREDTRMAVHFEQLERCENERDELRARLEAVNTSDGAAALTVLNGRITTLRSELDAASEAIREHELFQGESIQVRRELTGKVSALQEELESASRQEAQQIMRHEALQTKMDSLQQRYHHAAESHSAGAENQARERAQWESALQLERDRARHAEEVLTRELGAFTHKRSVLEGRVDAAMRMIDEQSTDLARKQGTIESLEEQVLSGSTAGDGSGASVEEWTDPTNDSTVQRRSSLSHFRDDVFASLSGDTNVEDALVRKLMDGEKKTEEALQEAKKWKQKVEYMRSEMMAHAARVASEHAQMRDRMKTDVQSLREERDLIHKQIVSSDIGAKDLTSELAGEREGEVENEGEGGGDELRDTVKASMASVRMESEVLRDSFDSGDGISEDEDDFDIGDLVSPATSVPEDLSRGLRASSNAQRRPSLMPNLFSPMSTSGFSMGHGSSSRLSMSQHSGSSTPSSAGSGAGGGAGRRSSVAMLLAGMGSPSGLHDTIENEHMAIAELVSESHNLRAALAREQMRTRELETSLLASNAMSMALHRSEQVAGEDLEEGAVEAASSLRASFSPLGKASVYALKSRLAAAEHALATQTARVVDLIGNRDRNGTDVDIETDADTGTGTGTGTGTASGTGTSSIADAFGGARVENATSPTTLPIRSARV